MNRPILVIDNYDSFVFNVARYFEELGRDVVVERNDAIDIAAIRRMAPAAVEGAGVSTSADTYLRTRSGVT